MTTRYIITAEDYRNILLAAFQFVEDDECSPIEFMSIQNEIFNNKKVPDDAKGFFVIDDDGSIKCVRFPD